MKKSEMVTLDGHRIVYRPWFRTKDGRIIRARNYGKRVFRIVLKEDDTE